MLSSVIPSLSTVFSLPCHLRVTPQLKERKVKEIRHKDGTNQRERERATRAMVIGTMLNVLYDVYGHTHENVPVPVPLTEVKLVMV